MTRVDLITGFLGAGKTTFIHRYLKHLGDQRVRIIENEFGSIGVDADFLRDEDCEIDDLSGMCMCCRGKDRFMALLVDAARRGYDRVLVEPSGIYDVDEFFSAMEASAVAACCEIGSVLAVVDAGAPAGLSGVSADLMFSQLAAAGKVILSKTQLRPGTAGETVAWLNALIAERGGHRRLDAHDVCAKDWDDLTDGDFEDFMRCGYRREAHEKRRVNHEELFMSAFLAGRCRDEGDLNARLDALLCEPRFGGVIRAKGYARDAQKRWYAVNCTRDERSVQPADVRRGVLVVVGQDLDEAEIQRLFEV